MVQGTLVATKQTILARGGPVLARNQPSLAANGHGGVGGGLSSGSDPEPSGSLSASDPEVIDGSDRARVSAGYSATFEAFWEITWRTGAKGAAAKAWTQSGKPTAEQAAPAVKAYVAEKRRTGGTLAHVSSWLRAGGATQTEWHLPVIGRTNTQPAARPAPYHAPTKPSPQLPAGTDAAAEFERWRRERDQLADKKPAP